MADSFFPNTLKSCPIVFLLVLLSMRKCYNFIFVPLYVICLLLLAVIKSFSLSLILNNLNIPCLGEFLFVFIILEFHWTSWICEFIVIKFGKIWAIISSNIFHTLTSFFPLLGIPIIYIIGSLKLSLPHSSVLLCSFLFYSFSPSMLHFASFYFYIFQVN